MWWYTGKGCPEQLWMPYSCKCSKPGWMRVSITGSSGKCPHPSWGTETRWSLRSLQMPTILSLYDYTSAWSPSAKKLKEKEPHPLTNQVTGFTITAYSAFLPQLEIPRNTSPPSCYSPMEGKGYPHTWPYSTGSFRDIIKKLALEKTLLGHSNHHILLPSVIQVGMWHTRDPILLTDLRTNRCLRWEAGWRMSSGQLGSARPRHEA